MHMASNTERNSRHGNRSGLEARLGRSVDGYCSVLMLQSHLPSAAFPYTLFFRFAIAESVAVVFAAPGNPSDTVLFSRATSSMGSGGTCHQAMLWPLGSMRTPWSNNRCERKIKSRASWLRGGAVFSASSAVSLRTNAMSGSFFPGESQIGTG